MVEEGRDSAGNDGEPAAHVHTFLIADVRGYTRFTQEHGDEEAGRLAAAFARLSREVVVASGGKVIEFRGDEALCVFNSARQAIRAAVELQRDFRRQAEGGSLFPLPIGIGLDAGEAVPIEGGYRGAALNTAARLCSLAQPGQILATETTVTLAQKVDGIRFRERRAVRLKGLEKPVRLHRGRVSGAAAAAPGRCGAAWWAGQTDVGGRGHRGRDRGGRGALRGRAIRWW